LVLQAGAPHIAQQARNIGQLRGGKHHSTARREVLGLDPLPISPDRVVDRAGQPRPIAQAQFHHRSGRRMLEQAGHGPTDHHTSRFIQAAHHLANADGIDRRAIHQRASGKALVDEVGPALERIDGAWAAGEGGHHGDSNPAAVPGRVLGGDHFRVDLEVVVERADELLKDLLPVADREDVEAVFEEAPGEFSHHDGLPAAGDGYEARHALAAHDGFGTIDKVYLVSA
jgi:hypothetical protein